MAKDTFMYVRLRAYNKRRGILIRRYLDSRTGILFDVKNGWYKVSKEVAARLEGVCQRTHDPESLPAFDVISPDAKNIRDTKVEEEATKEKVIDVTTPPRAEPVPEGRGDLVVKDLPQPSEEPKPLGIKWSTGIDDMRNIAESIGINTDGLTKKQIFADIKENVAEQKQVA